MNEAQRIRITEDGWGGYTGPISNVMFENAISVEPVSPMVAQMIGSLIRIEACDDNVQLGAGAAITKHHLSTTADVALEESQAAPVDTVKTDAPKYTRDDLAAIADSRGVAGLREIASTVGAKGRGIVDLIADILAKQGA